MKIALSGATGNIGKILRKALPGRGFSVRSHTGRSPGSEIYAGEDVVSGDLRSPAVVDELLCGMEVLVHMAGTSVERPLPEIIENNLVALHQVYEGALRNGVRRIIFASSNHAFGMYSVNDRLKQECSYRPDGFYGLSKMWGEGLARLYWDKHGLESVCLRIGSSEEIPENKRHLSTWLGREDLLEMVDSSIRAKNVGYATVWGVSNNACAYYDLSEVNAVGYAPVQNAQEWAGQVEEKPAHPSKIAQAYQGGAFAFEGFTRKETAE